MHVFLCLDMSGGMLFNHRRQSEDAIVREHMLSICAGKPLMMNAYSQKQFAGTPAALLQVGEQFLSAAGSNAFCFVEDQPLKPYLAKITQITVFRWNKKYPADTKLDIDLSAFKLKSSTEFAGKSHEVITQEEYVR